MSAKSAQKRVITLPAKQLGEAVKGFHKHAVRKRGPQKLPLGATPPMPSSAAPGEGANFQFSFVPDMRIALPQLQGNPSIPAPVSEPLPTLPHTFPEDQAGAPPVLLVSGKACVFFIPMVSMLIFKLT
jgi:hypothetical protein